MGTVTDFIFLGSKVTVNHDCSQEIKTLVPGKNIYDKPRQCIKRDITLPTKVHIVKVIVFLVVMYGCESWAIKKAECCRIDAFELWCWRLLVPSTARRRFLVPSTARHHVAHQSPYSQSYGFFSSHVWMWELNHKEGWVPKNWCFWSVVLEKTLNSFNSKENKPVNPKRKQPWLFIGRTDAEAPIFLPLMQRADSFEKDLDAGKDWGKEEKGEAEDKLVCWHHWLDGYEFEQTLGDSEGQWFLVCYSLWGAKSQTRLCHCTRKHFIFLSWRLFHHLQRQCVVSWILLSNAPIFSPSLRLQPSQVPCIRTLITPEWSR